jgi:hypothetical protein
MRKAHPTSSEINAWLGYLLALNESLKTKLTPYLLPKAIEVCRLSSGKPATKTS